MATTATAPAPLHSFVVDKSQLLLRRAHILGHIVIASFLIHYRATRLSSAIINQDSEFPLISWSIIFFSELLFFFVWILVQSFALRRVTRSVVSAEKLPTDAVLPGLDVFICTADVKKEPVIDVMNTVISAMAMDYPSEKLNVYLSDDGGSAITLHAIGEAEGFARLWVPFCRKYGIKTLCPHAYFTGFGCDKDNKDEPVRGDEFQRDYDNIKLNYEQFKQRVDRYSESVNLEDKKSSQHSGGDPLIKVFDDKNGDEVNKEEKLPLLVYVARERKPSYPHHSKAGALNALLRISGIITNSPYMLVLDCDMYCNDPLSARQAMCFLLDNNMAHSFAFVQFPQIFVGYKTVEYR